MSFWNWFKPRPKIKNVAELATYCGTDVVKLGWWMYTNIWYKKDTTPADEWKLPERTLKDRYGDCEDFALLAFSTLREMGARYAECISLYPTKGIGHCICVFKGFELDTYLWWYDNGVLQLNIKASNNLENDLDYICELAAERCGWQLNHWRHTGFKI